MLYKFKSKATGDLIMLEPNGRRVLEAIGKDPAAKGIILAGEIAAAIGRLESAIAQEEADGKSSNGSGGAEADAPAKGDAVTLRQRAVPFIDMLRRAQAEDADIVWGV